MHGGIATHYCESSRISELEQALINLENVNDIECVLDKFCPKTDLEFSLAKYLPQINKCFSASTIEGILKNLEEEDTEWAKETIKVKAKNIYLKKREKTDFIEIKPIHHIGRKTQSKLNILKYIFRFCEQFHQLV